MTFRATLVLLGFALAGLHAAPATYQRSEEFATRPPNWRYFNPNQGFGFFPDPNLIDAGEAGGTFFPKQFTSYYADTALNGAFNRSTPLSASGRITLNQISFNPNYTNSVYVAHFRTGTTNDMFVNIVGMALTGNNHGQVDVAPVVQFSNGNAFLGRSVSLPTSAVPVNWSYTWDPTGGALGLGLLTVEIDNETTTLTMGVASSGIDYTLNAFGLYQPAFVQPNSNTFSILFIRRLAYTALVGPSPKLHVNAPRHLTTASSPLPLTGTAHTVVGNRVTEVRYRVVHNGNVGGYKKATGIDPWSANIRIPSGTSRIDVTAFSDNGLSTTASRTVNRTP